MSCNKCIRDKLECLYKSFESCNKWLLYEGHPISIHQLDGDTWYICHTPEGILFTCYYAEDKFKERWSGRASHDVYTRDGKSGYPFPF